MSRGTHARGPVTRPSLPLSPRCPTLRALHGSRPTAGEALAIAAQVERAARFGHRFGPDKRGLHEGEGGPASPGSTPGRGPVAAMGFPIQRAHAMKTRSQAKAKKKAEEDPEQRARRAATRLGRWHTRGVARKAEHRFPTGRFKTSTGIITISPLHRQRITQAQKTDYGGQSFGGIPPYSGLSKELVEDAISALFQKLPSSVVKRLSRRQKLATSLATGLSNVSENDKAPGMAKLIRALARRRAQDASAPHPLDPKVNPAVSTAAEARDLMSGETDLNEDQIRAITDYGSDSSDEEDEDMPLRTGLLKHLS